MDFYAGETVIAPDGQVGTVLAPVVGRGNLEYNYPNPSGRGTKLVKAHPVLLDGGEVRVFVARALTRPGTP